MAKGSNPNAANGLVRNGGENHANGLIRNGGGNEKAYAAQAEATQNMGGGTGLAPALSLAHDDSFLMDEDTVLGGDVLGNDDILRDGTVTLAGDAGHGTVSIDADGTFTYAPDADFYGADSFSYTYTDVFGNETTATVAVTVENVNDAPEVSGPVDLGDTTDDAPITFSAADLLVNASDVDGDVLSVVNVALSDPAQGSLVDNGDGTFSFDPADGFDGTATIAYEVSDGIEDVASSASVDVEASGPSGAGGDGQIDFDSGVLTGGTPRSSGFNSPDSYVEDGFLFTETVDPNPNNSYDWGIRPLTFALPLPGSDADNELTFGNSGVTVRMELESGDSFSLISVVRDVASLNGSLTLMGSDGTTMLIEKNLNLFGASTTYDISAFDNIDYLDITSNPGGSFMGLDDFMYIA
jgi:VCBS repeat-containing protein